MAEKDASFEEEEDIRNELIVLLLGSVNNRINSKINFQKELFLVVQSFPKFQPLFQFIPHKYGPYSNEADYIIENYPELYNQDKKGIELTSEGKEYHNHLLKQMSFEKRKILEHILKNIRSLYDKLNDQEFMFLIYETYGYTEKSEVFNALMKNRRYLARKLLDKGVITQRRYQELISERNEINS